MPAHRYTNPFQINLEKNTLVISINDDLTTLRWYTYFGKYLNIICSKKYNGTNFSELHFDFTKCHFTDPTPLLSLLLFISKLKENFQNITITLPDISITHVENNEFYLSFVKFLAQEGFIELMIDVGVHVFMSNKRITETSLIELANLQTFEIYPSDNIHKATIVNTEIIENFELWADSIIKEIQPNLRKTTIDNNLYDLLLTKIKIFLIETFQNIKLHAYRSNVKNGALYIRWRKGLNYKAIHDYSKTKRSLHYWLKKESVNTPRLEWSFAVDKSSFIEVYVQDIGEGIVNNVIRKNRARVNKKSQYIFRDICEAAFLGKLKRESRRNVSYTNKGGLHSVASLLGRSKDFINGWTGNEFIGLTLPFPENSTSRIYYDIDIREFCGIPIPGTNWHSRISITQPLKKEYYPKTSFRKRFQNHMTEVLSGYIFTENKVIKPLSIYCETFSHFNYEQKKLDKSSVILYQPKPGYSKYGIWTALQKIISKSSIQKIDNRKPVLIIGDIPNVDFNMYVLSLKDCKIYAGSYDQIEKCSIIILISRMMKIMVLKKVFLNTRKTAFTFEENKDLLDDFINDSTNDLLYFGLLQYFYTIKYWDSIIFWQRIKKHNYYSNSDVYLGNIEWSNNKSISSYINYTKILQDEVISELSVILLERLMGIFFQGKSIHFQNIHRDTDNICKQINAIGDITSNEFEIFTIGSVFLSGKSEHITNSKNIFYFLIHSESKSTEKKSLLYWPNNDWITKFFKNKVFGYKRVGKTPFIAKGGNKFFPIPRYKKNTLMYCRSPKEMYEELQKGTPNPIKLGHHTYENHHEILYIDTILEFDYSFSQKSGLALFLISNIYSALCKSKKDLSQDAQKDWFTYIEKQLDNTHKPVALIIYYSHFKTENIIKKIKPLFKSHIQNRILSISSATLNRYYSSFLPSPLELIKIEKTFKRYENNDILIYDDTIISGRTRKEIKHLLFYLKASKIKTLSIVDRQRLPFYHQRNEDHRSYWRIDLPIIGSEHSCTLCTSFNKINTVLPDVISEDAKSRINKWAISWRKLDNPSINYNLNVVNTYLSLLNPEKKYGLTYDKKTDTYKEIGEKITITSLFGLIIYLNEIFVMTGDTSKLLEYLSNDELSAEESTLLLCSILLIYRNFNAEKLYTELILTLINLTNKIKKNNLITALAALIIINTKRDIIENIFNVIKTVDNLNFDIKIALGLHLTSIDTNIQNLNENHKWLLSRIYYTSKTFLSPLNTFHREIFNDNGVSHQQPIYKLASADTLCQNLDDEFYNLNPYCIETLNSLSIIKYLLKNQIFQFRRSTNINVSDTINDILDKTSKLKNNITLFSKETNEKTIRKNHDILANGLKLYLDKLKDLNSLLFIPMGKTYGTDNEKELRKTLNELISDVENENWDKIFKEKNHDQYWKVEIKLAIINPIFPVDNKLERWVYFDQNIYKVLFNTLMNVVHTNGVQISHSNHSEKAHMWITSSWESDGLLINFINFIENNKLSEIQKKIRNKKNDTNDFIKLYNIKRAISIDKDDNNRLRISYKIPYTY